MDIDQLTQRGGFYLEKPVKRDITWTHYDEQGEELVDTFSIFVRRLPYGDVERMLKAAGDEGSMTEELIHRGVRLGEKGDQIIPLDSCYLLDPELARLFADAVEEVNNRGKKKRKSKKEQTTSGTNSSATESAGEPSQKQNGESASQSSNPGKATSSETESSTPGDA